MPQRARSALVRCSQLPALQASSRPTAPSMSVGGTAVPDLFLLLLGQDRRRLGDVDGRG